VRRFQQCSKFWFSAEMTLFSRVLESGLALHSL
jgi:hypothetical protein